MTSTDSHPTQPTRKAKKIAKNQIQTTIYAQTKSQSKQSNALEEDLAGKEEKHRSKVENGEYTHHERINNKIIVFEGIESCGGVDSIFVGLAQLKSCHHRTQCPKHHIEEQLHFRFVCDLSSTRVWERESGKGNREGSGHAQNKRAEWEFSDTTSRERERE